MRGLLLLAWVVACADPHATDGDAGPGDGRGIDGPAIPSCPAGQWCAEQAPVDPTTLLHGVHAIDQGDVLVVGDGGTIARRRGGSWSAMASGTTENLRGVWAASGTDAWAVGENRTVLRYDGAAWAPVTDLPDIGDLDYSGVWGAAADDVWLIGTSRARHWNGATWTTTSIPGGLLDVAGSGSADVWIAGEQTYLRHYTGSWDVVMPGGGSSFFAIEALAPDDVWASTAGLGTMHFDGTSWAQHATGSAVLASIHAVSAGEVWGVAQSRVARWDGASWTVTTPPAATGSLYGIGGAGGHLWAVGANATILHRN